jgi:hypothetical protein
MVGNQLTVLLPRLHSGELPWLFDADVIDPGFCCVHTVCDLLMATLFLHR